MDIEDINYSAERILIVDDDEGVREPLIQMLRTLGFQADAVKNGADALDELKKNSYSFLLTDIRLPQINGIEVIRRAKIEIPDLSIVAMTGYSKEYSYVDVINAGATDFINKPFGIGEIEAKVRRAIIERNIKDELSRLSITDSLTGLFNQRHFYSRLQDEITRARRQGNQLSLILLDLDNFKEYNDTHGHLAGDDLLHKVGGIINAKIRQGVDSGYRYGGDEFAVILIDADSEIGQNIVKRIEEAISEECNLTASFGLAHYSKEMTLEEFVTNTDKFLYKSKRQRKIKR